MTRWLRRIWLTLLVVVGLAAATLWFRSMFLDHARGGMIVHEGQTTRYLLATHRGTVHLEINWKWSCPPRELGWHFSQTRHVNIPPVGWHFSGGGFAFTYLHSMWHSPYIKGTQDVVIFLPILAIQIPDWFIVLVCGILLTLLVWGWMKRRRRLNAGRCLGCNYDLRGSPGPTCPECGAAIQT